MDYPPFNVLNPVNLASFDDGVAYVVQFDHALLAHARLGKYSPADDCGSLVRRETGKE